MEKNSRKAFQGDNDGSVARNLRNEICFRREPANICSSIDEYFLIRVIHVINYQKMQA